MAAVPPNAAQLLRAAFSRRGFSLPDDSGAAAVSAKLVALMSASPENDNVACKGSNNSAADGLARQFEAYAMATGIAPSELTPALVEAFEREARASAATKRSAQAAVGAGLSWDDAADALADGTNVRLPRMGGGSQKEAGGKQRSTRSAAAAVRAAHAATTASTATAPPPTASAPPPSAAAAAATPPSHNNNNGPRHEATPGSAFARRERSGEVVASLHAEVELPSAEVAVDAKAAKKKAPSSSSAMEVDGGSDVLDAEEAAASAAAALEELPVVAAAPDVELLCPGPSPGSRVMTDSLADRAAFVESRVERFAASFERLAGVANASPAAAAASSNDGGGGDGEDLGSAPCAPVGVARQTARGVFVGRVVDALGGVSGAGSNGGSESSAPPQRLDLHSASLEGSAAGSGGRRAKLDVSGLRHRWRLFPGQVVAVVGACPAGHTLVASALLPSAPPPRAPPKKVKAAPAGPEAGLKVVVAAGPFTAPGDVAFEALDAVLSLAAGSSSSPSSPSSLRPADAVVLVGPFVDERHPSISSGSLDVTFDELFERGVVGRISAWSEEWTRKKKTKDSAPPTIVLLPSPRDVAAGALSSAFPSKPLELPLGTPKNVVALPNPATFRIGGTLVVGATGHDVLRDLSASQAAGGLGDGSSSSGGAAAPTAVVAGVAPKDRMAGLAGALVEQGCYYPLYPPARGTMLDARLALPSPASSDDGKASSYQGLAMPFTPDVLLLPSDLAPFARVASAERPPPSLRIDESGELLPTSTSSTSPSSSASVVPPPGPSVETVAVNPGRAVTAGGGGGTAAVVMLAPRKKSDDGENGDENEVVKRCRVDIVRL